MRSTIIIYAFCIIALGVAFTTILITDNNMLTPQSGLQLARASSSQSSFYLIYLIGSILVIAVVFIIKKKLYARILQKGMPFLIIYLIFSSGLTISLYAMIFLTHTITLYIDFVALLIGITLCVISYKTDRLHNIFAALISITVMALLAITFSTYILLIILIILSVWDLIAVFKLKFMQALAQQAIDGHKGKMLPLFIYTGSKNELKNKLKPQSKENKPSGAALLGLGDIIFPGAVICSALLINDLLPLLLTLGFLIGLGADMILSAKYNKPLPALPLIFVGMIIFMIL